MIYVDELRKGNWIHSTLLNSPHQVRGFVGQYLYTTLEDGPARFEDWQPIPLTPEILEKCGAAKLEDSEWSHVISISALKMWFRFNAGKCYSNLGGIYMGDQIQHLHQLQNLKHAMIGSELIYKP